ncbi:hypothetical protein HDU87_003771 [Geranomyces variabilis]|uniref:Uncharacterized protein n=1 Tax=Geranomyces variabilis TaxID=109894 RepID=A0AAD5TKD2_9FUNG|nr:hypothetical protein HDU87_003771 [Geranomyces variabilis]
MQEDVARGPPATGDRRELESEIETLQTDICDYLNRLPEQLLASDRAIQTMTKEFISLGVIAVTPSENMQTDLSGGRGRSRARSTVAGTHYEVTTERRQQSSIRKPTRVTGEKIESKILRAARVDSPHEDSPTPAYPYRSRSTPFLFAGDTIFLQSPPLAPYAYDLAMCVAPLTDYHVDASISVRMLDRSRPATSTHITFFLPRNTPVRAVSLHDAMENMVDGRLLKIQWERKDVRREEEGKTYFLERALDKAYTCLAKINWPEE